MPPKLREVPGEFSVVRLAPGDKPPVWAETSRFYALTRTEHEVSLVCEARLVPPSQGRVEAGWRALMVVGPLDFALTGILAAIAAPLALAKISIFALSTFDTDYVLVKSETFESATKALVDAGFTFER